MTRFLLRRCLLSLILACGAVFSLAASPVQAQESNSQLEKVIIQLKWKHQFQFAGFYAALEQGYYREAGLDVVLKEAGPDIDPIVEVVEGRADYGVANSELVLYRLQGKPVTALAVILQHSPLVLLTLPSSEILSPQDLIGRRVMFPEGIYGANTLGILKREGVERSQITQVPLSFNVNDLVTGKVDAMVAYVTDQPHLLIEQGISYQIIDPRSYGIDFYGDTLFTESSRISDNPEQVKRVREATLKGWTYAVENPSAIVDLIIEKYDNTKNRDHLSYEAKQTIELIVPKLVEIGHMNPGRWKHIADTFVSLGMTPPNYSLEGFIYSPDVDPRLASLQNTLWWIGLAGIIILSVVLLLTIFNSRLKSAVATRTNQLSETNARLVEQTEQLLSTRDALNRLNHELEERVESRTQELLQTNSELTREIAERKERELSLKLLSRAVENSGSGVIVTDNSGLIQYANSSFIKLTGYENEFLIDQPLAMLKDVNGANYFSDHIKARIKAERQVREEVTCLKADGETFWVRLSISEIIDDEGHNSHYVFVCEDITLLKQRKEEMERLAFYDPLTGLENRLLFKLRLEKAVARLGRDSKKFAVLFIDLDHFKTINDNYGHDVGDLVLKTLAERLKKHIRKNDSFARISGDEFTLLLNDIEKPDDVKTMLTHMFETLEAPVYHQGRELSVSISVGATIAPDDGCSMKELMKNADLAMYRAKRLGRHNFQFFSADMNDEVTRNTELEAQINRAINEEEFFLLFQPQLCLNTKRLVGIEALARWRHPEQGVIEPLNFIGFAEESGLMIPLGSLIHRRAFQAGARMREHGLENVKLSVNLSTRQLQSDSFIDELKSLMTEFGIQAHNFEFEIKESSLVNDLKQGFSLLTKLKELGFEMSIDDFGSGYFSLNYLKQLPISSVKIDRSFIHGLADNQSDQEITSAVIAMAHRLHLKVVAEGVETSSQEQILKQHDCDFAQGFFYGKPMPLEEIIEKYGDAAAR